MPPDVYDGVADVDMDDDEDIGRKKKKANGVRYRKKAMLTIGYADLGGSVRSSLGRAGGG